MRRALPCSFLTDSRSMKSSGCFRAGALVLCCLLGVGGGLSGCAAGTDQAELDLLANDDPAFGELVRVKSALQGQIALIQNGLEERRRDMEQRVAVLRQTYEADRQSKEQVIHEHRSRIKAQKDDFEAGYTQVKSQLQARNRMKSDIEKAIREGENVLSKKDKLAITGKEIGEWEARIENLRGRLGPLQEEINGLETLASLKQKKLKYL